MKKLLLGLSIALSSIAVFSAQAAAPSGFTDQKLFAGWLAPSVQKMLFNGIIKGYENGTFQPSSAVSRGELAVILDRFASVLGQPLNSEPQICNMMFVYGLNLHVNDQNGQPITDATVSADTSSGTTDTDFTQSNGIYTGLGEAKTAYYNITVKKAGYSSYYETIKLEHGTCHVQPQTRTITLFLQK